MALPRVVNIFHTFPSALLRAAADAGRIEHVCLPSKTMSVEARREWFKAQLLGAQAAIIWVNIGRFGKEHIDAAGGSLRVVATYSVGTDHIDIEECRRRGVAVAHTPYKSDDAVANATVLLMLTAMRRSVEHLDLVRRGEWAQLYNATSTDPLALCGVSIERRTVGFYGFGRIAQKVAERVLPMGPARILYKTSSPKPFVPGAFPRLYKVISAIYPDTVVRNEPDLETLAAESDFLVCLTSLVPETIHSINSTVLGKMKKHAVLVNVSRGPVIDTQALVDALQNDRIFCAALDVVEGEPDIPSNHPLLTDALRHKVVLFPHFGSAESHARTEMTELTARNVLAALGIDNDLPICSSDAPCVEDKSTYFV
ncbi:hypothetical protein AURDEDRAFT_60343 [Auricularia subglabra TFB-10046 SS5]|nr:hypothetical protein AURDEDRAFT_60343 [Auricularia subglabra TFB-10046 SS5]